MRRSLTMLTVAIALIGGTGLLAGPALALRPQTFSFTFEDSFTDRSTCGFRVLLRFTGSVRGTEYFDRSGNLIRVQLHGEDFGTATNPKNGNTASGSDAWLEVIDVRAGTDTIVGLFFHLNFPGAGIVLIDAGKVTFEADGDIVFEAGPHQVLNGDFAALCAALR